MLNQFCTNIIQQARDTCGFLELKSQTNLLDNGFNESTHMCRDYLIHCVTLPYILHVIGYEKILEISFKAINEESNIAKLHVHTGILRNLAQ